MADKIKRIVEKIAFVFLLVGMASIGGAIDTDTSIVPAMVMTAAAIGILYVTNRGDYECE